MSEIGKEKNLFVGYEYKEIAAERSRASFLLDGYTNFGWEIDENISVNSKEGTLPNQSKIIIHLKRNRKMINHAELTRLQRNFEACMSEIETLEKSKTSKAMIYAMLLAVIGTAFMAGSTFAVTAQSPHILLCIALAIPGFLGWLIPYFLYKRIVEKQTKRLTPLIEEKYNEIYEICEKGSRLLH